MGLKTLTLNYLSCKKNKRKKETKKRKEKERKIRKEKKPFNLHCHLDIS